MPSFDVVSEVDIQEVRNAVDQAQREVGTRFDFKGADAEVTLVEQAITLEAGSDFQIKQMLDILHQKLVKRGVDIGSLEEKPVEVTGKRAKQTLTIKQGLDQELAKKVIKAIKEAKLKVQAAIQGDQVRVTGKKRDDLQEAIALLRKSKFDLPLQYNNFRD